MEFLVILFVIVLFVPFIAVVVLGVKAKEQGQRLREVETRLARLEQAAADPDGAAWQEDAPPPAEPRTVPAEPPSSEVPSVAARSRLEREAPPAAEAPGPAETAPPANTAPPAQAPPREPSASSLFFKKMERRFLDNWTGLIGAVVVVMGAGFLSSYSSVNMSAFGRVLLILLLAALPAGGFFYLRKREMWQRQASWLRSISGAVFLFACLGSAGIPGLQWVNNPLQSLAMLVVGIAVNLWLSTLGGRPYFASFHTLLSLLALAVVPPGTTSLFMAGIICLYAIIHTYRTRWDLHLLLTVTAFFAYHLYWIITLRAQGFNLFLRFQGGGVVSAVFLAAAFIHYRKSYGARRFDLIPFLLHLANWFYFAAGIVLYTGDFRWRTFPLAAAAAGAGFLAQLAKKKNIPWLVQTDYMTMQILAAVSLATLIGWQAEPAIVVGLIFAETLLFYRIMIAQERFLLYRIGVNLSYGAGLAFIGFCLADSSRSLIPSLLLLGGAVLTLANHRILRADPRWLEGDTLPGLRGRTGRFSLSGFLAALLGTAAFAALINAGEAPFRIGAGGALIVGLLLWERKKNPSRGLSAGSLLPFSMVILYAWGELLPGMALGEASGVSLFLAAACGAGLYSWSGAGQGRRSALFARLLAAGSVLVISLALLGPLSPLLPGLLWILLAAGATLGRVPPSAAPLGLIFLGAYLVRYFGLHHAAGLAERYLTALPVLPVFFLWYRRSRREEAKLWRGLSFLQEAGVVFLLALCFLEAPLVWISPILEALALVLLLFLPSKGEFSRLRLYSLWINWGALAFLSAAAVLSSDRALFLSGGLTVAGAMAYLVAAKKRPLGERFQTPSLLQNLEEHGRKLARRYNAFLLYPLLAGCALFIYGAAPSASWTFLWALECFLIYGASLFLGEEHFRFVSQGGLVLCVIRLIFFDLSGSSVFARGLVFLGVGILMLGVNFLYNRYKGRFTKD